MKILQKLVIIFIFVFINAQDLSVNKKYIDELLNYKVELPKDIYNPFFIRTIKKVTKENKVIKPKKTVFKFVEKKLTLLAILNNKALVKLEGTDITKWLKVGDVIDSYRLKKILNQNAILVTIKNKTKIISMKNNNINIKVIR